MCEEEIPTVMDFRGKVVVVTGGGSGIGQACCREFVKRNAAVPVVEYNVNAGRQTAEELRRDGGTTELFAADISKESQGKATTSAIVAQSGGINILVNNPGI
jgi:NAD(P)-dependent dehydrogenase (short-subunit alcohol dehydrogenase family)